MRELKLITRFYGGLFFADFLVTLSCVFLIRLYGQQFYEIIGILFWFKVITIVVIFYAAIYYKPNELYYYQNLGLTKIKLGFYTSIFDFLLWLVLIMLQRLIVPFFS